MINLLRRLKITSDMAYFAAAASVLLSIVMWFVRKPDDQGNAERFGIFVGLWAPTLMILGRSLEEQERKLKVEI